MSDYFKAYLSKAVTPARQQVLVDAFQALQNVGVVDQEYLIDQELALAENADTEVTVNSIESILRALCFKAVGEMGVAMDETTELGLIADTLTALDSIENYDDPETLWAYTDAPEGPEAALADILELTGPRSAHEYLEHFLSVTPAALERVAALTSRVDRDPPPDEFRITHIRHRLAPYLATHPECLVQQDLHDGLMLGTPLPILIDRHRDTITGYTGEQLAWELWGLALASDLPDSALKLSLIKAVETIIGDANVMVRLDVAFNRYLQELPHEKA